jgi:ribonuclease-3
MEFLKKFNIIPNNIKIYESAFMHSSYVNENKVSKSYERLEFLGDAVIDLVISEFLYNNTQHEEGQMTKLRAAYVCENALAEYAKSLNLSEYIKVGHGEEISGGKYKKTILADIFESLIGAIYIDQGYDIARDFVNKIITPYIKDKKVNFLEDYKSTLQELIQTNQKAVEYEVLSERGPSHNKEFVIIVKVNGLNYGVGSASSKKEAEQLAAKDALDKLAINNTNNNNL